MDFKALKENIEKEYEISKRINILIDEYQNSVNKESIKLNVETLLSQIKILNDITPGLIKKIEITKPLPSDKKITIEKISLTKLSEGERKKYIQEREIVVGEELELERGIIKRQKKALLEKKRKEIIKGPSFYVRISNKFFSDIVDDWTKNGSFDGVKEDLIKAKMPFLLNSYISVTLFTTLLSFIFSLILFIFLLFFDVNFVSPFITIAEGDFLSRFLKIFWIIIAIPLVTFIFLYIYPSLEKGYLGKKIDEELPFLTIHLAAIAGSKIEPAQIFRILAFSEEYIFTKKEMVALINKINVYGYNIASALRDSARKSPSSRLRDLFNGMSTTITSGGDLEEFLNERSKTLLFEYRLDGERRNKIAETFMDIYISVVIAAPMILMLLLIIIKASGLGGVDLSIGILTLLILSTIALINIIFLIILHLKQPKD